MPHGQEIHHLGRTVTREEHEEFHRSAPLLSDKQHDALMKRMGINKEQDEEWHRTHLTLAQQRARRLKQVDALALGGGFLAWCVKQGWLEQLGKTYYAREDGLRELRERFGIVA